MKLRSIEIENFRAIGAMSIALDPALTVLHGGNAQGKTSLLAAAAVALGEAQGVLTGRRDRDLSGGDVRFGTRGTLIRAEDANGLTWQREIMASEGSKPAKPVSLDHPAASGSLRLHLKDLIERKATDELVTLPVFAYYDTERAVLSVPQRKRDFSTEFDRLDAYADALAPKPSFKALIEWFYAQEFAELSRQRDEATFSYRLPALEAVRSAIRLMLPDVSRPRIEPPVRFMVTRRGVSGITEELSLDQLSGGYRIMLALVADLARRMVMANPHLPNPLQSEAIVLIDELDLHLHPEWQQRVVTDLRRTFPNTQFIISTHSPAVLSTVEPRHIIHLRDTRHGVIAEQETGPTFGAKAGDVLEMVMGVAQRPDNAFSRGLARYKELIAEAKGRSQEAMSLRDDLLRLSPDDPAVLATDIELKTRDIMRDIAGRS